MVLVRLEALDDDLLDEHLVGCEGASIDAGAEIWSSVSSVMWSMLVHVGEVKVKSLRLVYSSLHKRVMKFALRDAFAKTRVMTTSDTFARPCQNPCPKLKIL